MSIWYAVREPDREDDEPSHTVSLDPNEHGWTNDSGVHGYGLTWAQAQELAYATRVLALARKYRDLYDPEDEYSRFHDLLNEAQVPGDKGAGT